MAPEMRGKQTDVDGGSVKSRTAGDKSSVWNQQGSQPGRNELWKSSYDSGLMVTT